MRRRFHTELSADEWRYRRLIDHAQEHKYLYTDRGWHLALFLLLATTVVLIFVPAFFLFLLSFFALVALLWPQAVVLGLMWGQAISRSAVDEEIDGTYYWLTDDRYDFSARYVTLGALLSTGAALGLIISGYVTCATNYNSMESLAAFVFGADATPATPTS